MTHESFIHHFPQYVVWPGPGQAWSGQHAGGGGARPWPSGAGGEASGAGPGTLGTPGP